MRLLFIEDAIEGITGIMIEFLASLPEGGTSAENDDPGDKDLGPLPGEKVVHGDRLTLKRLEKYGIIARVLELQLDNKEINVAAFVRLNPLEPDSSKNLK